MTTQLSWVDIALKLHLPEMTKNSPNKPIIEHMTEALVRDASIRIRRDPEVVVSGLAERPRTTPLPPLSTISNGDICDDESFERITLLEERELATNTKLRVKAAAMANRLTSTQIAEPKKYRPSMSLANKGKPSNENWIPEPIRFRSLHRELMTMKENLRSTVSFENDNKRELKRFQTTDLQKALLEEELRMKKKLKCGCCLQIYSYCNLPLKIPVKAILDIRKKWSGGKSGWWDKEDERLAVVPRCYEGVRICRFCSQFFDVQEEYRPSFDKIQKEIKRKHLLELKQLEKQYWDPLKMGELEMERLYQLEMNGDGLISTSSPVPSGAGGTGISIGGFSGNHSPNNHHHYHSQHSIHSPSGGNNNSHGDNGMNAFTTNGLITIQYE